MKESIDPKDIKMWSRMGPRAMFGQFMIDLAKKNEDIIVLSADLGRSSGLDRFKTLFPDQYISVGISEQNLIGVASGLAKEGYKVFNHLVCAIFEHESRASKNELGLYGVRCKSCCSWKRLSMAYLEIATLV